MSKAAVSVFSFGIYLFVLGPVLVVFPNALLSVFDIPETSEVWIRVVGMLVVFLGLYYVVAARNELVPLMRATVYGRFGVLAFFIAFVVLGLAPAALILFGVIDAAGAMWTASAIRQ